MLHIISQNLLSPTILFFILGASAGFLKSDLNVPDSMGRYIAIYLMMSIGFKGGVSVSEIDISSKQIILTIFCGILFSFVIPFIGYFFLKFSSNLDNATAAALSAHYGSVSIVTFATCVNFLQSKNIEYSGFMAAILAIMEVPAILSGLYLAHRVAPETNSHIREEKILAKEIFTNGSVLLLLGSFIVGITSGHEGLNQVSSFLVDPFQGVICIFMLDMGLIVTKRLQNLRLISASVILFGIYMPLFGAIIGLVLSHLIGLELGSSILFMTLCASASYIAVPSAMKLALPEAKESVYVPISLGVTFPFNIIFGIPLYFALAKYFI